VLTSVVYPVMFVVFGAWSTYLGVRSWRGLAPRPSRILGSTRRAARFVDRCIVPLSLLYLSLGITLGLAGIAAHTSQGGVGATILAIAIVVTSAASVTFLALTFTVYRYWKPRRLIPAYLRYETYLLPGTADRPPGDTKRKTPEPRR
jgi:hypothetical protein